MITISCNSFQLRNNFTVFYSKKSIAQVNAIPILNSCCVYVRQVPKKVAFIQISWFDAKNWADLINILFQGKLFFYPSIMINNLLRTVCARFTHWSEKRIVKFVEIIYRVNDTWRRPCANSVIGVLTVEPSWKCSRITSTNNNPIWFCTSLVHKFNIHRVNKPGSISKGLLWS